ncbi:hypothetical protein F5884DRAFT_822359 [Xylogone sp. PMI_703]|nr:hypothetical protein F5884DRAFT_822359 [Xylogone sp. PMI_703]
MTLTSIKETVQNGFSAEPTTRPENLFTEAVSDKFHCNEKTGYKISLVTLGATENRRMKILTIGAGVAGIMLAYYLEKECTNIEHIIYEKNEDLGGTWLQNRYPNCACDVPSHSYQFNFAMSPEWPTFYSNSEQIHSYLTSVVDRLDLRKYMNFNSEVVGATFDEHTGIWTVNIKQKQDDGTYKNITENCDLLLGAIGILDRWEMPKIPGLSKFKGRALHTAGWNRGYGKEEWKNDRVAVIGSGASAVQVVPGMQPYAKKIEIFCADGHLERATRVQNYEYSEETKEQFRNDHEAMVKHGKKSEDEIMMLFHLMVKDGERYKKIREQLTQRMRDLKDEKLIKGFTPNFSVGCRRISPGDPCMIAVTQENVECHFTGVKDITETGLIADNGEFVEVDAIVCATGFDVSYRPRFPLVGLNGTDLREKWRVHPEGYLGLACPEIPNYLTFIGPNWPVENGSVMGPLLSVVKYAVKVIQKMQTENIKYWVPNQEVTDEFNAHTQSWFKGTVWEEDCNAWYKNRETGRVDAVWPGSALHYIEVTENPRWEDFDIKYHHPTNRFNFLGRGFTTRDLDFSENSDRSPYLNVKYLDPRYYQ